MMGGPALQTLAHPERYNIRSAADRLDEQSELGIDRNTDITELDFEDLGIMVHCKPGMY
jgi:hypothetical protein